MIYGDGQDMKLIRATNLTALFYAVNAAVFVVVFALFNAVVASYWLTVFALLFASVPYFCHIGLARFAKYLLILTIYFGIGFFSALLGKEAYAEFIYITALCVPFMLSKRSNDIILYVSLVMSIGLFLLFRFTDIFAHFSLEGVNPNLKFPVMAFVFLMPFVVLSIMKNEQIQYTEKLKHEMREKELLSREVHHRVKNNFQVICSLFNMQMREPLPEKALEFLATMKNRIYAMAMIHERQLNGDSLSRLNCQDYLPSIVYMLLESSGREPEIKFRFSAEESYINLDKAVPIGLLVFEIVSNSLKHTFCSTSEGEIYIDIQRQSGDVIVFYIGDNGQADALHDGGIREGLGTVLIESLIDQVNAKIEKTVANGTHYKIVLQIN